MRGTKILSFSRSLNCLPPISAITYINSSPLGRRAGYRRERVVEKSLAYNDSLTIYVPIHLKIKQSTQVQTEQEFDGGIRPAVFGKLICIGRNYAQHAAEMQATVPDDPMIFLKPSSAVIGDGGEVVLPAKSKEVHHEVELVAMIGRMGKNIPVGEALDYVASYAVGLDMTARDLQAAAKKKGEPWAVAKGF